MGPSIRHDNNKQRHTTRLSTIVKRNQQFRARAAVGSRALAEANLATTKPILLRTETECRNKCQTKRQMSKSNDS